MTHRLSVSNSDSRGRGKAIRLLRRGLHRLPFARLIRPAIILAVVALSLVCLPRGFAEAPKCATCRKTIHGKYIRLESKPYCSRACFLKALPKCSTCGKPISGKYIRNKDRIYCSKKCFESTLPKCEICGHPLREAFTINGHLYCRKHAEGPACSKCQLPFVKARKLPDGRCICHTCDKSAIYDRRRAVPLYRRAQEETAKVTGFKSDSLPDLKLVGLDKMPTADSNPGNDGYSLVQQGLYDRIEKTITSKNIFGWTLKERKEITETVILLTALTREELISTASHEITHDIIAEKFPKICKDAPSWVEEGICQYVAAEVCRNMGFTSELERIETCPDREYGDGYRYFRKKIGAGNWNGLVGWIRRTDVGRLPKYPLPKPPR